LRAGEFSSVLMNYELNSVPVNKAVLQVGFCLEGDPRATTQPVCDLFVDLFIFSAI
jgi:hypothetical protein